MSADQRAMIPANYFENRRKAQVIQAEQEALDTAEKYANILRATLRIAIAIGRCRSQKSRKWRNQAFLASRFRAATAVWEYRQQR